MDRKAADFDASKSWSPISISAAHTAVLLMDYHNMIVGMCGDQGLRIKGTAASFRAWALERDMHVFHCLIDLKASPPASNKMASRFSAMRGMMTQQPHLADEWAELASIGSNSKERTVTRTPGIVSAMYSDKLIDELKAHRIQSLILAGLSSSGCVLSTTRDATDRGYIVTVVEDACADRVPGMHEMLMEDALTTTAHVATLKDIQSAAWK